MDNADAASLAQQAFEGERRRAWPEPERRADGGIQCHACGDTIPEARRRAMPGCKHCVDCQEIFDRRRG